MEWFLIFLGLGVWQDIKARRIKSWYLLIFGFIGIVDGVINGFSWIEHVLSVGIGILLLFISHLTEGKIGEGDGWFFVVSGFFLNPTENFLLLISGLFICSGYGLLYWIWGHAEHVSLKGKRIPFLPFLIPGGIWLAFYQI